MQFSQIIGQPTALAQLKNAARHNRVSHAYIFAGPEGVGKRQTALAFASLLLCDAPQDGDSCGRCVSCLQIEAGTHPDLTLLAPDGKSLKIKQIRALRDKLSRTAAYGGYSVVIIDGAETMTAEAEGAFLKTMEEPSGPVCFILIATASDRLFDTIRSRAQLVRFKPLNEQALESLLGAQATTPAGKLAVSLCGGSAARAIAFMNDESLREERLAEKAALETLMNNLATSHDGALLRFADGYMGARDKTREAVLVIRQILRIRLKEALAAGTDLGRTLSMLHDTAQALERLEINTDPGYTLGALLLQMAERARK